MSSRAILDSSPVARGHTSHRVQERQTRPRPLKRSASTASLLTPPRTVQQKSRKRSKSRGSDEEEETDDDDDAERDEGPSIQRVLFAGRKRQRTERLDAVLASLSGEEADAENPFRDDDGDDDEQRLSSPVTFRINKAPVSPPPSRRQNTRSKASKSSSSSSSQAEVEAELELETPRTPDGKSSLPIRDTPNNPFLEDDCSPMSVTEDLVEPSTPTDHHVGEKPTISYVFRGVRTTFANPMYDLPDSVREHALLAPEHPDFEPDPLCPPKLLFPEARAKARQGKHRSTSPAEKQRRAHPLSKNRRRPDGDEWDAEEEPLHVTPPKTLTRAVQSRS